MRISDWSSDVCSSDLGEAVGVHHAGAVQHDGDMARRVDEIAALQRDLTGESVQRLADGGCLLVGVARRLDAGAGERELHQRGAVETDAAAPAPVIGGAEELQRGGDEVGGGRADALTGLATEPAAAGAPAR